MDKNLHHFETIVQWYFQANQHWDSREFVVLDSAGLPGELPAVQGPGLWGPGAEEGEDQSVRGGQGGEVADFAS